MMNTTVRELEPGFHRTTKSAIEGTRTRHVITLNPNKANPGESIYTCVPNLKANSCLVPGSLYLLYDFKVAGTRSWHKNNLSRLLTSHLTVKIAGEVAYDNTMEGAYGTYKNLWKSNSARGDMVEYGIYNENIRKLTSNDDTANGSTAPDNVVYETYGIKRKTPLDKILGDHGLHAPHYLNNGVEFIVRLPPNSEVLVTQSGQAGGSYQMEGLELEYETIENLELAETRIGGMYDTGISLAYEHVTLLRTETWNKDATIINTNVNIPRKSMKAIVMLLTAPTRDDSEEFDYPNIKSVNVTVEGVPNSVYSQGIPKRRFYEEARRLFGQGESDQYQTVNAFYFNQFALVIDLRSIQDNSVHKAGKRIVNTQNGIVLEIRKTATGADVLCHMFVVSDSLVNIVNKDLKEIVY